MVTATVENRVAGGSAPGGEAAFPSLRAPPNALRRELPREHQKLLLAESRTVAKRAGRLVRAEELVGSGWMGLMAASRLFDPNRGVAFGAFARLKVRAAMLDELRDIDQMPRRSRSVLRRVERVRAKLLAQRGSHVTAHALAAASGIPVEQLNDLETLKERMHHQPLDDAHQVTPGFCAVTDVVANREAVAALEAALCSLPPRHRHLLGAYYAEELTFKQIGARLGVTEGRVSQLHNEALKLLRQRL